jgi:hypothetical protein
VVSRVSAGENLIVATVWHCILWSFQFAIGSIQHGVGTSGDMDCWSREGNPCDKLSKIRQTMLLPEAPDGLRAPKLTCLDMLPKEMDTMLNSLSARRLMPGCDLPLLMIPLDS